MILKVKKDEWHKKPKETNDLESVKGQRCIKWKRTKDFKKKVKKAKELKVNKNKRFKKWKRTNDLKSEKGRKI